MIFLLLSVGVYLLSTALFALRTLFGVNLRNLPTLSLLLGFSFYTVHFFRVYISTGHFPVGDFYGMVSLVGNFLILMFVVLDLVFKKRVADFGFIIAFIGFLTTLVGLPAQKVGYKNPFYVYHILSAAVAYASLILAGISSVVKFLVERKLRSKHIEGFMVPVNLLRRMERVLLNIGFIFLTLTLIFGSIWAKNFLGKHWVNDPKLILTLAMWIYYAFLIHLNLVRGLKPSTLSLLSFVGFLIVLGSILLIRHTVT